MLYDWISRHIENKDKNIFDVIAGTSIGAINGAIILSHFLNKKKADVSQSLSASEYWKGSADILEKFWQQVQTKHFFTDWVDLNFWPWDLFHNTIKTMKEGWNSMLETTEGSIPNIQYYPLVKEWFDTYCILPQKGGIFLHQQNQPEDTGLLGLLGHQMLLPSYSSLRF